MADFSSDFDALDFFAGAPVVLPVLVGTGGATFAGEISVVDAQVFDSAAGKLVWSVRVMIGTTDVSARLSGEIRIDAAEDAARVASLSVTPASVLELASYDSAAITIDVVLQSGTAVAAVRRFTGRVETVDFKPAARLATLACRDGYQERIRACSSAAEVAALCGGLAKVCPKIIKWDDLEPDPAGYFSGLLSSMAGATTIDASGVWRAIPWHIGTPAAAFAAHEIFDDSLVLEQPARKSVPAAVIATLTHRYPRLHVADISLNWPAPPRAKYLTHGIPLAPKSMILAAMSGADGWHVKGEPLFTEFPADVLPIIIGPQTTYLVITDQAKQLTAEACSATLYRRWYQTVDMRYRVSIDMGGLADRDESIAVAIESTFDVGEWEKEGSAEQDIGLYTANPPYTHVPPAPYVGLRPPFPPSNGALDHHADITSDDLQSAAAHVVARALRLAVAGKRQRQVKFARPLDPRWEIGSVLSVNAYGVAATGQLVAWSDVMDIDSGVAVTEFSIACPAGSGTLTEATATVTPPTPGVTHSLPVPTLDTFIGASFDTPTDPADDMLQGYLANALPTAASYSATAPIFEQQFRVILPEIPADVRDPLVIDAPITASIAIANGAVGVSF